MLKTNILFISFVFLLPATDSIAAASSDEGELFEGWLYALHKPTEDVTVSEDFTRLMSSRTIAISIRQGQKIISVLKIRNNHILINGELAYGPISMRIAGGFAIGSLNRPRYEYAPAHRYFVLRQNRFDPAGDTAEMQGCKDLEEVKHFFSSSPDPVLVVDMPVWLNIAFTKKEQKELSACKIPERVPPCSLTLERYRPLVLTYEESGHKVGSAGR